MELIDKTLNQPVTVDGIVNDLLHGSTDGEEVLVLFILKRYNTSASYITAPEEKRNPNTSSLKSEGVSGSYGSN